MVSDLGQKINRSKLGEGIYLLYFALMVGARALGLYEGQTLYNITLVLGLALFAVKMVVTKHTLKEYLIAAFLLILSGIVYIHTGEKGLIVCFSMMLGMKEVNAFRAIKVGVVTAGIIVMTKIFLGVFGFTGEIYYPQYREGIGEMFRHSLGYAHPNTLHMNVLMLSMMVIYLATKCLLKKRDIKALLIVSALVFGFNVYVFQYSGSRTGLLGCIFFIVVNAWLFIRKKLGLFEKIVSYAAFPLAFFIAVPLPFLLNDKYFDLLNRTIFTTRYSIARYFWSNNHISLFGIRLNNPIEGYATYGLDMAQLYLFLQLGIAAFVVIALLTEIYVYEAIKMDLRAELSVLMGMLFLGIWEPFLYNLGFKNFSFVFMGAMLYAVTGGDRSFTELPEGEDASFYKKIRWRRVVLAALLACASAVLIYMAVTDKPSALYGDRQEGESGNSLGMEEIYLSADEVIVLKSSGDIIVGYVDESTPMYRYDTYLAVMEYNKRMISTGLWCGLLVAVLMTGIELYKMKERKS